VEQRSPTAPGGSGELGGVGKPSRTGQRHVGEKADVVVSCGDMADPVILQIAEAVQCSCIYAGMRVDSSDLTTGCPTEPFRLQWPTGTPSNRD
jgi:hypothetical protein